MRPALGGTLWSTMVAAAHPASGAPGSYPGRGAPQELERIWNNPCASVRNLRLQSACFLGRRSCDGLLTAPTPAKTMARRDSLLLVALGTTRPHGPIGGSTRLTTAA